MVEEEIFRSKIDKKTASPFFSIASWASLSSLLQLEELPRSTANNSSTTVKNRRWNREAWEQKLKEEAMQK